MSGDVIAVDGTKVRAHNSKKNNYSPKKIERRLVYIQNKTNEYLNAIDQSANIRFSTNLKYSF